VLSVLTVILGSMYPLGAVVQGKIADNIGLREVTFASGVALLAAQLLLRVVRPHVARALDEPVELPSPI
jgi:hypothetical protein